MGEFVSWLLNLIYPAKCIFCGKVLPGTVPACCDVCIRDLPEYEGADRSVTYYNRSSAVFFYEEPVRSAVLSYKFHGTYSYARVFGRWMAAMIRDKLGTEFDLITWVPCSKARKWKRGYDQSRLLCEQIGKELGIETRQTLVKVRNNPPQSGVNNAARRKANVMGVYVPYQPECVRGKRILVIDDVLTTGATLSECGKILRMAGAETLVCAVLAAARQENE